MPKEVALGKAAALCSQSEHCSSQIMEKLSSWNVSVQDANDIMDYLLKEKYIDARAIHFKMLPLFRDLFIESNPIPIKYVMKRLGYGNGKPRLPLTELSPQHRPVLDMDIAMLGLI